MKAFASLAVSLAAALLVLSPVAKSAPPGPTIVDVALAANAEGGPFEGQLDSLIAAVLAADPIVLDTLSGNGQFTVFAPTDRPSKTLAWLPMSSISWRRPPKARRC
jgi:hypothetical protein